MFVAFRFFSFLHAGVMGSVEAVSTLDEGNGFVKCVVVSNTTGKQGFGSNKITHFNLSNEIPDSECNHSTKLWLSTLRKVGARIFSVKRESSCCQVD